MKWAGSTQALAASSTPGWCLGLDYRLGGFPAPPAQGVQGGGIRDDFVLVSVSGAEVSLGQPDAPSWSGQVPGPRTPGSREGAAGL